MDGLHSIMLKTRARPHLLKVSARALAILVFLYFLNAFIQTGYDTVLQVISELIVGILWLLICFTLSQRVSIVTILALSFGISILWGIFTEGVPVDEFRNYYIQAARLSSSGFSELFNELFKAKSPPTIAYYAIFHWLLGPSYVTNYVASATAWAGGVALIYWSVRPLVDEQRAKFICSGLALCPAFVVFSPVISTESLFFLLSAACVWLISKHLISGGPFPYLYIALGLVTGTLFLTRAVGVLALIVCLAVILGVGSYVCTQMSTGALPHRSRPPRHPLILCAVVVVAFTSVWFAHGQLSLLNGQGFQVTANPYGALYLLFGTSIDAQGRWNIPDLELVGYRGENKLPRAETYRRARKIAIERIASDPVGFARFALTDKMHQLWGREYDLYSRVIGGNNERRAELRRWVRPLVFASLDGGYRVTFVLFLILLFRELRRPSYLLALGVIALFFSLPHIFIEVRPRYHLAMTPFIIVGSMLLALDVQSCRAELYAAARSKVQGWFR